MCGIFGIVAHNARDPVDILERATSSLAHRGPDDSGTVVLRDTSSDPVEIGLGNRRLAVLDLSPLGHQPMHDPETGNWIVYNGEIYNFRDVRAELQRAGTTFVSHSDTEVVLKAYARWGEQCLPKFRGMFAFAIWDATRHRLFLARDQMGIKPLYYAQTSTYFVFASEVRSVLGTGLVPRRLNPAGLLNYLTFGSCYDPLTLIEGISALPAGHTLTWERGSVRTNAYWDLLTEPVHSGEDQAFIPASSAEPGKLADLASSLEEAVRLQLVSDVPVGVFLSGGIDSGALVSVLRRGGITPSTFSIVFKEAEFSEAEYSRAVARKFKTDHHEITVSQPDFLTSIPDALRAMDLPTMDGVNTYFVSRETRAAGVKVALSGLGGDEVFAGYSTFRTVPRMERFANAWRNVPSSARSALASAFESLTPDTDQNRKLTSLARDNGRLLHPYFLSRTLFTPRQRDLLFQHPDRDVGLRASASQRAILDRSRTLDPINRISYLESRCYMVNTLLRDADFMSMSQGLEVRVPLIDHVLAKGVLGLKGSSKLGPTPKQLLVGALHNSLPDEIVHRSKRGFTMPFEQWMRSELRAEVEPQLNAERIQEGPLGAFLDGKQVELIWKDFLRGKASWSRPWSLYVLQRWCQQHSVGA